MYQYLVFIIFFVINLKNTTADCNIIAPEFILNKRSKITPILEDLTSKPINYSESNNLRRRSGSPVLAKGEFLIVKGIVTDLLDNPVTNAKIRIWQADNFGYYKYLITDKYDYAIYDVDFEPTGTAITNNLGYYQFLTIFPGYYGNRAPHIHVLISDDSHHLFETINTEIFFEKHPRNKIDKKYNSLSLDNRKLVTCQMQESEFDAIKTCSFNIKLDFINPYT